MEILGVDIGGTGIKGAIVDTNTGLFVSERIRIKTPKPSTPSAIAATLKELVDTLNYHGPIGCGFPARVDKDVVTNAANIDESWINIHVADLFSDALDTDVFVANDADVAGLAEVRFGAGNLFKQGKALFLTIGTGIGSALFLDGKLYEGTELGHLIFKGDSAERYCSEAVREREDLKWKEWGQRFNEYLQHLEFLFSPDVFILGGGACKKFEKFVDCLEVNANVRPAVTMNLAGIIGAALYGESRLSAK